MILRQQVQPHFCHHWHQPKKGRAVHRHFHWKLQLIMGHAIFHRIKAGSVISGVNGLVCQSPEPVNVSKLHGGQKQPTAVELQHHRYLAHVVQWFLSSIVQFQAVPAISD
jgi:hypothetical protein